MPKKPQKKKLLKLEKPETRIRVNTPRLLKKKEKTNSLKTRPENK